MAHQPIRRRHKKKLKARSKPYNGSTDEPILDLNMLDIDKVESIGKMKQRHKREIRQLRDQVAAITKELKKLSKRKPGDKEERRDKTRLIRQMTETLRARHAEEIASASEENGIAAGTTSTDQIASSFTFNLPNITQKQNEMKIE